MSEKTSGNKVRVFHPADFIMAILCFFFAVLSINLFRADLMQTINLRNVEPVGTVVIRKNVVQRRHADRVLWDRLAQESPVYPEDLIRVAEFSAATLVINGGSIDLNENTLIRITLAADGETLQIIMSEGDLSLATAREGGKISLDINGLKVSPRADTVLNVSAAADAVKLQVSEGTALIAAPEQPADERQAQEIHAGSLIVLENNVSGSSAEKAVVVAQPAFNARYINGGSGPFPINFSWYRINFKADELLRLEISGDKNFNTVLYTQENLDNHASIAPGNGLWYWRLSSGAVLDEGHFTIINGTGPRLQSPALSSVFRHSGELPAVNFQWDELNEASSYILEVSAAPDFTDPYIRRQSQAAFFSGSGFGDGTWYWRVMPVFSTGYTGNPSFSQVSYFTVERAAAEQKTAAVSLAQWLENEIPPALAAPPVPPELHLKAPAQRTRIEGLTALRQQTEFTWECDAQIVSSRFVLSSNSNPFQGRPAREIQNPDFVIPVSRLDPGTWYWNVEVQTANGFTVRAAEHGIVRILPIPLLPAPANLQPARNRRFTMKDLQAQRSLSFGWQAVRGANAYILTIYQQTDSGRRQVFRTQINNRTSYLLEDLRFLDRGTFIWQLEAISRNSDGAYEQRGNAAESAFIMDFLLPGAIQVEGTGVVE